MQKVARYLVSGALLFLCLVWGTLANADEDAVVAPATVESNDSTLNKPAASLRLLPKDEAPACPIHPYRVRMGERIFIEASGNYATRIRGVLENSQPINVLSIYFDGTQIPDAPVDVFTDNAGVLVLYFDITRNAQNREVWDSIFKRKSSFDMPFVLSVRAGSNAPWVVQVVPVMLSDKCKQAEAKAANLGVAGGGSEKSKFVFYVGSSSEIFWTALISLVVFVGAFIGLAKTNALRDRGHASLYSLGRSQMACWGLLVILAFVGVLFINGTMEEIPLQMLMLLGITGGTGLAAYVIDENKEGPSNPKLKSLRIERAELEAKASPTSFEMARLAELNKAVEALESVRPPSSVGFFRDICNDGTGLSFHRLQVVIWTMVLGGVFVISVIQTMSMPEFPGSLLILMGVSNVTYLGFKIPE